MELAIAIAIALLIGLAATLLSYRLLVDMRRRVADRAAFKKLKDARDRSRVRKSLPCIYTDDWKDPQCDYKVFERVWMSLARYMEIHPELLRPDDRLSDIVIATEYSGPDCYDLYEFARDLLPDADRGELLSYIERSREETVGNFVRDLLHRMHSGKGDCRASCGHANSSL